MAASIFDVNTQLTFYGAYHSNRINVLIHIICVPLILWSAQVLLADILTPEFLPNIHHEFNEYLAFDMNIPAVFSAFYIAYYFILEPFAALLYTPQLTLSLLTATAFAARPDHITVGATVHAVCWIAQFIGHGFAEKRAPALLDNLLGAVVLAPFFVHLEILFALGYRPQMHKRINNEIGKEIARIKKIEGDKRRAAAAKAQ
ncbi:duf962 domain-containing protein [Moniliophthora roreri MCA 2997]|uniref:Duf962 domain-containing protein n=1 Tax=Moniliophthora roreri (strain MCA 2997) TaxID=1381753 RepID=V2X3T2_MONRO|nr:duf962 domain-containing protein [Moniliophthora roreri MCA 2997]